MSGSTPKVSQFFSDFDDYSPLEDLIFSRLEEESDEIPEFISVLEKLRAIREDVQTSKVKLQEVWKAVEWYYSGDCNIEKVK